MSDIQQYLIKDLFTLGIRVKAVLICMANMDERPTGCDESSSVNRAISVQRNQSNGSTRVAVRLEVY